MSRYKFRLVQRVALWEAHNKRCIYCDEPIRFGDLEIDHIIPESVLSSPRELDRIIQEYGLTSNFEVESYYNWVPCHRRCNLKKSGYVLSRNRALVFLEQAQRLQPKVTRLEKVYSKRQETDKMLVALAINVERGLISADQVLAHLRGIDAGQHDFKLIQALKFSDRTIIDQIGKADLESLMDSVITTSDSNNVGLELVGGEGGLVRVYTCHEFDDAKARGFYARTTYDMKMESSFNLTCGIIKAFAHASIPDVSYIENPRVGIVDIILVPVSILSHMNLDVQNQIDQAAKSGKSLQDWLQAGQVEIKAVSQNSLEILYRGFGTIVWELLRADLNDDGVEDILLYNRSYADGGSFGYGITQILTRRGPAHLFEFVTTSWQNKEPQT